MNVKLVGHFKLDCNSHMNNIHIMYKINKICDIWLITCLNMDFLVRCLMNAKGADGV